MTETITPSALCAEHRAEYDAWSDYRLPAAIPWACSAARDLTVEGVNERRRMRFETWRSTINTQQGLIVDACARHCH